MTAVEIAAHLLESCGSLREFDSYMFGSSLFGIGSDVDILIVCPPGAPLAQLKEEIELAGHKLPLHVLYMQPSEARETGFIINEGCVPLSVLEGAVNEPAWRCKPSWYLVATDDRMIPPPAQQGMAKRASATVVESAGSHTIYVSKPDVVASIIKRAALA